MGVCPFCLTAVSANDRDRVEHPDGSLWHGPCHVLEHGAESVDFAEPSYDREPAWLARGGRKGRA